MTNEQKREIWTLRTQGLGYKLIAKETGINQETVKSFLRRYPVPVVGENVCKQCGRPVVQTPKHRKKQYCSDTCRMLWWSKHQDQINRKAWYPHVCEYCGKEFQSYAKEKQRFCSTKCFANFRRKKPENDAGGASGETRPVQDSDVACPGDVESGHNN